MKNIFKIFFFILIANVAFAGGNYQIGIATSHITRTLKSTIGSSESVYDETRSPLEIKFGKVLSNNVYLGGIYNMGKRTITSGTTTTVEQQSGYGLTAGYDMSNSFIHLSYYLSAEYDFGNNRVFKEGSGLQMDFAWKVKLSYFLLTPQISYRSLSYKKRDINGVEVELDASEQGEIIPEIGIVYEF